MARESVSEEDAKEFSEALGIAFAQWGSVESQLYILYCTLCRPGPFPNAHSVTYEAIVHLDAKIAVVDALVEFMVKDDALLKQWSHVHSLIKRKTKIRNKIAHWRVYNSTNESHFPIFLGPQISIPSDQVPGFGTSHGGAMRSEDLFRHAESFIKLPGEIREFTRVCGLPT